MLILNRGPGGGSAPETQERLAALEKELEDAEDRAREARREALAVKGALGDVEEALAAVRLSLEKTGQALAEENGKTRKMIVAELEKSDRRLTQIAAKDVEAAVKRVEEAMRTEIARRDDHILDLLKSESRTHDKQIGELRMAIDKGTGPGEDSANLPGAWRLAKVVREGARPEEGRPPDVFLVVEKGGKLKLTSLGHKEETAGAYKVADDERLRAIDLTFDRGVAALDLKAERPYHAVYHLQGDALTVCLAHEGERPTGLKMVGEPRTAVFHFRRMK